MVRADPRETRRRGGLATLVRDDRFAKRRGPLTPRNPDAPPGLRGTNWPLRKRSDRLVVTALSRHGARGLLSATDDHRHTIRRNISLRLGSSTDAAHR